MATQDIRIDALIEATRSSFSINHTIGAPVEITYSFLASAPSGYQVYDFQALTQAQRSGIESMLAQISTVTGITFRQVDQGGILHYGLYTGRPGIATSESNKAEMIISATGADVWLSTATPEVQNLQSGYGRQLALHETAHALGLKHPEQYSSYDTGPYLSAGTATAAHTVMGYNGGNTDHLGDYDVLALQYLYGPAGNAPASASNRVDIKTSTASGSYFNDQFVLDTAQFGASVRVSGSAGIDELKINVASTAASFQSDLKQFTYTKSDGSFAGVYLDSVERVRFTDKSIATDIDGNAGQAFRLYKAAFDRTPDKGGLGYWINEMDKGASLKAVAQGFVSSTEFINLNGSAPTNAQLTTSFYQHVLGRGPDPTGLSYWVTQLESGAMSRSEVLMGFSESTENKIAVTGQIQGGIEYTSVIA